MKYIWKRLYKVDFRRRFKVKLSNLRYVYIMKNTDNQIEFIKKEATLPLIKNGSFFVKIKNKFIFVSKNRPKILRRNNFKAKFNRYNNNNKKNLDLIKMII